ncbi:Tat pathway signal protein [Clostridium sp. chh4-2]|uniref:tripartite tricarboxylate transporter permease n=1 Tax=Clostridium sp. chh4-2 TaxID=2067550 RepID=UPI000CCEE175|nr:tripartite tricarboxylate transporter permease [Clostridium sp. chh4-2]PNV61125.1 Tat pathway signal protein [Clostridium sp. chh4-2]
MSVFFSVFQTLFSPSCLALVFLGIAIGVVMGAIPGLGGGLAVTLVLPLTYTMNSVVAIAFLCSIYVGGTSGSFIGSVLMGIPGDVCSVATVYDGYQFTKQGDPVRPLSACVVANYIGTVPSLILAMVCCPLLANVAVKLGPWEYFGLGFCAITLIISLSKKNMCKGLMAAGLGLIVKCIGTAPICGTQRFAGGSYYLTGGIGLSCVMLGIFAGSTILMEYARDEKAAASELVKVSRFRWPGRDLMNNVGTILQSWGIGAVIGFLPGMGSALSNVVAYAKAKGSSKHPEEFGKGCIDGVIAPEVANNASIGGALVPMIALGIPGDGSTALLLGALTVQGVVAGPLMLKNYTNIVYMIYLACIFAATCVLIFEIVGMPIFPSILKIPYHYLYPAILVLVFLGAYISTGNIFAVVCTVAMAFVGVFMSWADLPPTPFILAYVLGETLETNLRRALSYSTNGWMSFFTRPVSCMFIVVAVLSVVMPYVKAFFLKNKKA